MKTLRSFCYARRADEYRVVGACLIAALLGACGRAMTNPSLSESISGPLRIPAGTTSQHAKPLFMRQLHPASVYKLLYNFGSAANGSLPFASLINVNGTLYGTTEEGGKYRNSTTGSMALEPSSA